MPACLSCWLAGYTVRAKHTHRNSCHLLDTREARVSHAPHAHSCSLKEAQVRAAKPPKPPVVPAVHPLRSRNGADAAPGLLRCGGRPEHVGNLGKSLAPKGIRDVPLFPVFRKCVLLPIVLFCNNFFVFLWPGIGAGLLPPANRAAAESGVAGLVSEAMATLCAEWLKPFLRRSYRSRAALPKTVALWRLRLTLRVLPGCCRASLADICTWLWRSPSFACPAHSGGELALMKVMCLQSMMFWTSRPELRLLVRDVARRCCPPGPCR